MVERGGSIIATVLESVSVPATLSKLIMLSLNELTLSK